MKKQNIQMLPFLLPIMCHGFYILLNHLQVDVRMRC